MSKKITVERCREILNDLRNDRVSNKYIKSMSKLSEGERFSIAKKLLPEIESYCKRIENGLNSESNQMGIHSFLLVTFSRYESISREEFSELIDKSKDCVINAQLAKNPSFPIDFLLDDSLFQVQEDSFLFWFPKDLIKCLRFARRQEAVSYYRGVVCDFEHMSDEMVLSVVGINLGNHSELYA